MNILQIQSMLTNLNDDQLKQEMLSPGVAPQFLVLSEMQRRQEVRNGGRPQQGPQQSMKDEAMQGLGGLRPPPGGMPPEGPPPAPPPGPMGPQGPPPAPPQMAPQGYAAGGPVGFADGGYVPGQVFVRNGVQYQLDALSPEERAVLLNGGDITQPIPRAPVTAPVPAAGLPALAPATPRRGLPTDPDPEEAALLARRAALNPPRPPAPAPLFDPDEQAYLNLRRGIPGPTPGLAFREREAEIARQRANSGRSDPEPSMLPSEGTGARGLSPLPTNLPSEGQGARGSTLLSAHLPPEGLGAMYGRNAAAAVRRDAALGDSSAALAQRSAEAASARTGVPIGAQYREPEAGRSEGGAWTAGLPRGTGAVPDLESGIRLASYRGVAPPGSGAAAVAGDSNASAVVAQRDSSPRRSYSDFMAEARTTTPDRLAGFEGEARSLFGGDAAQRRSSAGGFALMEAGLRMAGSTSPRLAGAISEGGLAGLQSYRQGLEEAKRAEREGFQARLGIASARGQQDAQIGKIAGDLSGNESREFVGRESNAAHLAAARMQAGASMYGADQGLAGHALSAAAQRDTSAASVAAQRYATDNPAALATLRAAAADPKIADLYTKAQQNPEQRQYYIAMAHSTELRTYTEAENKLRDDILGNSQAQFLRGDAGNAVARREYESRRGELQKMFPNLFPPGAGAAPAAPASSAPVRTYDPATGGLR